MSKILLLIALAVALCAASPAIAIGVWNVVDDWSVTAPNDGSGTWSYGYGSSNTALEGYFDFTFGDDTAGGMTRSMGGSPDYDPYLICNKTDAFTYSCPPHGLCLSGSGAADDTCCFARWKAPVDGYYMVDGAFTVMATAAGGYWGGVMGVSVVVNGNVVYENTVSGGLHPDYPLDPGPKTFRNTYFLAAGSTVDFVSSTIWHNSDFVNLAGCKIVSVTDLGFIEGVVTANAPGHPPMAGVTVQTISPNFSTTTGPDGRYFLVVPEGTYTVEASSPTLVAQQVTGVQTVIGQTTTVNFDLAPRTGINYYVNAATGNDANDGLSRDTAWKTIDAGDKKGIILAGDVINVAPGLYDSSGVSLGYGGDIIQRVRYQKDPGVGAGKVTIDLGPVGGDPDYNQKIGIGIQADYITIDGFEIKNCSWGIVVMNSPRTYSNIEIANCEIHAIRPGQPNLSLEYRRTDNSSHCGAIFNAVASAVSIHNNLIYDIGYPELPNIATGVASPSCTGVKIYNNTFANAQSAIATWNNDDEAIEFKNNIVTGMRGAAIDASYKWAVDNAQLARSNNLYYANAADFGWADPVWSAGEYNANPKFAAGAYTLDTGSPAINAGVDVGLAFQGSAPDIGAFETASTAAAPSAILSGRVTANVTGHPAITKATISAGGVALGATDSEGNYSIPVAPGTYGLTAARGGFTTSAVSNVTVAAGGTGTKDFDLAKAAGSTWYVNASSGNDANNGQTPSTAWATINRGDVLGVVKPGDTVMVAAGDYAQTASPGAFYGVVLSKCFGEAAAPIVYKADGVVNIDQSAAKATDGGSCGFFVSADYVTLDQASANGQFNIKNCQYGVVVASASNVVVANCNIHDIYQPMPANGANDYRSWAAGIRCYLSTDATLRNNVFNVVGQPDVPTDPVAGILAYESAGTNVYNNTMFAMARGVYATGGATDTVVRNNIFDYFYLFGIYSQSLAAEIIHSHNLFHPADPTALSCGGTAAPGMAEFSIDVYDSVGFVDFTDFYLQSGSAAINMGVDVGLAYNGPAPDLGAHETTDTAYPPQFCKIEGVVRYRSTGLPVEGAKVSLVGSSAVGITGADGAYSLVTTETGTWTLQAMKYGYAPKMVELTLVAGTVTTHDFYLSPGGGGVWDLSKDFSVTNGNPNGDWGYGKAAGLDGTSYEALPIPVDNAPAYPGLIVWTIEGDMPMVVTNVNPTQQQSVWPPFTSAIHPAPDSYGVARWTAPAAGVYQVYITFGAYWYTAATTDCHVLLTQSGTTTEAFKGVLDGTGGYALSYADALQLNVGDTIDALVGPNGSVSSDTTPIIFTIIGVDTTPSDVASVAEAKAYLDNELVSFTTDQIVTVASGTLSDTTAAYIESADRTAGIKIVGATVALGQKVKFQGYMGTDDNGERFISVVAGTLVTNGTGTVKSLGMLNKTITGDKIGLLVRVWGTVTEVDPAGKYVIVDDASGAAIKVMKEATTKTMALGKMVGVTGPASFVADGPILTTVVRARSNNDIVQYN